MQNLLTGFQIAFSVQNLAYCFGGVFLGQVIGVLPGIGPLAAMSMLIPVTYYLEPTSALIMLAGVYYGSEYGGSITSILFNIPGGAASAITSIDGYPMAKAGRAGVALFMTAAGSFIGGIIGILILMALMPAVVALGLKFGPAEYFALITCGLLASASVATGSALKGLGMVLLGLMLGCVGEDLSTGVRRFDFGVIDLVEGFSVVVVAMGLFGITEVIASVNAPAGERHTAKIRFRSMLPTGEDLRSSVLPILRGSAIGSFLGALPAAGPTIASFMSYVAEKRLARDRSRFGKGAIEGVVAPESANNAAAQTAFIPTLGLGIPGSASMAVILGALMIHGIMPGPLFVSQRPDMFWAVVASFWIGNVMLLVLNVPMVGLWVALLRIPYGYLYPAIICLVCIGAYSINSNIFDVWMVIAFGFLGYVLRLFRFEPAPLLIGFILGPLMEVYFRRAMTLYDGNLLAFLQRPISAAFLVIGAGALIYTLVSGFLVRRRRSSGDAPRLLDMGEE